LKKCLGDQQYIKKHTMSKIAFITGASSGIGKATALKLGNNGYDIIICGRRAEKLVELTKSLGEKVKTISLVFDVRDREEVQKSISSLPEDWKNISVLVNNAGNAHGLSSIDNGNLDDWDAMIDGNVKGLLYVSKAIIPTMIKNKKGHIINISSIAGKQTYANGAVYCASKKGVEAISEGMRLDLTQYGIKITNVAPGAVSTEFSEVRFKGDKEKAAKVYEGYEPLLAEDIADFISYALTVPERVTIADVTIYAKAQAAPTTIYKS
jgi:NADP-dependent 3-hydroxy acid dehydrogenase YdfG